MAIRQNGGVGYGVMFTAMTMVNILMLIVTVIVVMMAMVWWRRC